MPENAFEALCILANENKWCWKLVCTTCGHQDFSIGLAQIARRRHPADPRWVSPDVVRKTDPRLVEGLRDRQISVGREYLYLECASARIKTIAANSSFPDFLGYLGLALHYQESLEKRYRILTRLWGSELLDMVRRGSLAAEMLSSRMSVDDLPLSWSDLEMVENGFIRFTA